MALFGNTQPPMKDDPLITELAGAVLDALLELAKVAALSPRPKIRPRDIALAAEDNLGRALTPDERALMAILCTLALEQWRPGLEKRLSVSGIVAAHRSRVGWRETAR